MRVRVDPADTRSLPAAHILTVSAVGEVNEIETTAFIAPDGGGRSTRYTLPQSFRAVSASINSKQLLLSVALTVKL